MLVVVVAVVRRRCRRVNAAPQLTRLLTNSLGGNCRTAFIACAGPSAVHYDETCAHAAREIEAGFACARAAIE